MNSVTQIVRVPHGSNLYGTSTPQSDQDFKGVHLPSGQNMLQQRAEDVIERNVVAKEGTKNTADAIDEQSFSVQKFYEMLVKGDTVATEILFAPPTWSSPLWPKVRDTGIGLLNRQCKGFVGYCVRQAAKYGIKGGRMHAVKKLVDLLTEAEAHEGGTAKLATIERFLIAFAAEEEHTEWVNIPSPNGSDLWHIRCCDRAMPTTAAIKEALSVYTKVWENYGERARAAMNNSGIDWKAVSHAVRVARQALELLHTGRLTFPRPDAAELRGIKLGEYAYSDVSKLLERLVQLVQQASAASTLPEQSDRTAADALILRLYKEQVHGHV